MITALYSLAGERPRRIESLDEIARLAGTRQGCLWVDMQEPGEAERRLLAGAFDFHPLAVENCLAQTHHARLDDYGDYVYLIIHSIRQTGPLEAEEVDLFLGEHVLVSWHERPIGSIEEVRKKCLEVEKTMTRGPDRVLAELLDHVADGYITAMEEFDRSIDGLEDRLFARPGSAVLREVFRLKKDVLHFKRLVNPQRELLNRLARGESRVVSKEEAPFFRDAYDHVVRVSEMAESFRDTVAGALEVYLTLVANRTNEVVKVLTVFSIILMTLSLIAGLIGMNVPMPFGMEDWKGTFYVLLVVMGAATAVLLLFFRKRRWI